MKVRKKIKKYLGVEKYNEVQKESTKKIGRGGFW